MSETSSAAPLDAKVLAHAAAWMARLWSGEADEKVLRACERWRAAHPDHERAWHEFQCLQRKIDGLPDGIARQILEQDKRPQRSKRQTVRRLFGFALVLGGGGLLARRTDTWQTLQADYATARGEIREIRLDDGTRITLASATTVDVRFSAWQRLLVLHRGEILISTATEHALQRRPFIVRGRDGELEALGTRFGVRQNDEDSRLSVFEGEVELRAAGLDTRTQRVRAGECCVYSARKIEPVQEIPAGAEAWSAGVLLAENMRVAEFIAELARYRSGMLRCDPAIADLRVSGVFSLRDTDRALASLARVLPVRAVYRTPYWVSLQAA